MAAVQGEVRLVDPPLWLLPGHQGNGLGASIGEDQAALLDAHGGGQGGGRRARVGISRKSIEVTSDHRPRIGCDGIEAGRQVEHAGGVDPEPGRQSGPVTAVRSGRGRRPGVVSHLHRPAEHG